jgi:PTH2 family peptidyl-tRNA hydrolase
MAEWIQGLFTKICVQVGSEEALLDIVAQAKAAGLPVALIEDAGNTEFHGVTTPTCCAIGPADATAIDAITGNLRLL